MGTWVDGLFDNDAVLDTVHDLLDALDPQRSPASFAATLAIRLRLAPTIATHTTTPLAPPGQAQRARLPQNPQSGATKGRRKAGGDAGVGGARIQAKRSEAPNPGGPAGRACAPGPASPPAARLPSSMAPRPRAAAPPAERLPNVTRP